MEPITSANEEYSGSGNSLLLPAQTPPQIFPYKKYSITQRHRKPMWGSIPIHWDIQLKERSKVIACWYTDRDAPITSYISTLGISVGKINEYLKMSRKSVNMGKCTGRSYYRNSCWSVIQDIGTYKKTYIGKSTRRKNRCDKRINNTIRKNCIGIFSRRLPKLFCQFVVLIKHCTK